MLKFKVQFSTFFTTVSFISIFSVLSTSFYLNITTKIASANPEPGTYLIKPTHSEGCLNILDGSFVNGAPAVQGTYCDEPNAYWKLKPIEKNAYQFIAVHSNQCLNVLDASVDNGAWVGQGKACNTPNFIWSLKELSGRDTGKYLIINKNSGQCLNVLDSSAANGASVVQGTDCNKPNFRWIFEQI